MPIVIQLSEHLSVETPLGSGMAMFLEASEDDQWWTVLLTESRAFVTFKQSQIRGSRSYTHQRGISDDEMQKIIDR